MRPSALRAICLVVAVAAASAKQFTPCNFAKELRKHGFPEDKLAHWVCLAQAESSLRTDRRGGPNNNGSYDYGIFQINSQYWCGIGRKAGDCNLNCQDLMNDNLADDARCAKKIYDRHGFSAWYGWRAKCKGKKLNKPC